MPSIAEAARRTTNPWACFSARASIGRADANSRLLHRYERAPLQLFPVARQRGHAHRSLGRVPQIQPLE